jgi:hypothetical protein
MKPTSSLYVGKSLQVRVNGAGVKSFKISSGGAYEFEFDAAPGINELVLAFSGGGTGEVERLRFYAVP